MELGGAAGAGAASHATGNTWSLRSWFGVEAQVLPRGDSPLWLPRLSVLETYFIPKDGALASYKEYISMLPSMDPPEAFGQHPNADVASQITEARTLFETLLSLQPQITPTRIGGQSREEKVGTEGVPGRGKAEGQASPSRCLPRSSSWLRM